MLDGVHGFSWTQWCYKVSQWTVLTHTIWSISLLMTKRCKLFLHLLCLISTRVSNELGAGCAQGARLALHVVVIVAISVGLIIATTTILVRFVWGKLYSNEKEVIRYVAKILPLLALSNFLDGFQCVLSGWKLLDSSVIWCKNDVLHASVLCSFCVFFFPGAARGCGWQKLCAFINLGAYYVVGLPSSILFAFVFHTGGMVHLYYSFNVSARAHTPHKSNLNFVSDLCSYS